jgi:hypothetical protein
VLRGADGAADTFERLAYDKMAGRGRRVAEARGLMRLGNRRKPAGDGARWQAGGTVRNVEGNGLWRRGKRMRLMVTAPRLEDAPVVSEALSVAGALAAAT